MADRLKWGILATGGIARQFARGLAASRSSELVAVGSRARETAEAFAKDHGGKPYGAYDEVLADPDVQAVYIATPHHLHYDWTIRCARAGKGILCEKPFTLNALEAQRALNAVRDAKVFFMEAFMYRCHPQTLKLQELLKAGAVGKVLSVNAEFGFAAPEDWGNFRADGALGGGGLMDVGTYCVSFARLATGEEPSGGNYCAHLSPRGYDAHGSGCLAFPGGATAHFGTGIHANLRNDARIYGTEGWIHVDNPWKGAKGEAELTLYRNSEKPQTWKLGVTNDELYALEADAVADYFERKQAPYVTWDDTIGQMRALDMLRESAGLKFAAETRA